MKPDAEPNDSLTGSDGHPFGRFQISLDMLRRDWRTTLAVFARVAIVRAECLYDRDIVEYVALCDDFAPVKPGTEPPMYQAICTKKFEGEQCVISVHFEPVTPPAKIPIRGLDEAFAVRPNERRNSDERRPAATG